EAPAQIRPVQLAYAVADRPPRTERRHGARQLVAVHAVAARIGAAARRVGDPAARNDLLHHVGDLADLVVLAALADVEGAVVDRVARRLEDGEKRARDVLDVDERPPWRAVALHQDLAGRESVPDEAVDHDVGAKPRRHAIGGGIAREQQAEEVILELAAAAYGTP